MAAATVLALAATGLGAPAAFSAGAAAAGGPGAPRHVAPDGVGTRAAQPRLGECSAGELCLWAGPGFRGERRTYELSGVPIESCVPLPAGASAQSFANRTGRPVTVYQSRECAETGEFNTHPSGSWTPRGAYRVRAVKFWEK